jgi:hypothetical protein
MDVQNVPDPNRLDAMDKLCGAPLCTHLAKAQYPAASLPLQSGRRWRHALRPQKITLGEMRDADLRGLLIYCSDYHCSHWTT